MNAMVAMLEEKPFDMASFVSEVEDEVATPYITIPTRTYAKLLAAIEFLGGTALDVVGDAPYYPSFVPEPDRPDDEPPEHHTTAKALQLISWGDNGLCANDKAVYELVLRMTKTRPGFEDNYVLISLGPISKRVGLCTKRVSEILWGLVDVDLLQAFHRRDDITGHTLIYARAGKMPVWKDRYKENKARAKDARAKRICRECGGTKFAIRHICTSCGAIQTEAPHTDELVEELADATCTPTEDSSVGPLPQETESEASPFLRSTSTRKGENQPIEGPPTDSVVGLCRNVTYYIGPAIWR